MPETITIEYNENLIPTEVDQLRAFEFALHAALSGHVILGRVRWTAKLDSNRRIIYTLDRVTGGSGMLTCYAPHELSRLTPHDIERDILGGRYTYVAPLSDRPLSFEHLSSTQRADIVNHRRDVTILVPRSATRLGDIASYSRSPGMPTHRSFPDFSRTHRFGHSSDHDSCSTWFGRCLAAAFHSYLPRGRSYFPPRDRRSNNRSSVSLSMTSIDNPSIANRADR